MSKICGFLLLDKSEGRSSNQALYPVKKLLPKGTKIGHSGTLDPGATGLLVLALGRATRFISYLKHNKKCYEARLKLGIKTDSADIWGTIVEEREAAILTREQILSALQNFHGEIEQVPPMYSALKKDGRPLYELARQGLVVERRPRKQFIYSIELLEYEHPYISLRVISDAGTYIRTLIEDIASHMGEIATMTALRRLESDGFTVDGALKSEAIKDLSQIEEGLISLDEAFLHLPVLDLDKKLVKALKNGKKFDLSPYIKGLDLKSPVRLMNESKFLALLEFNKNRAALEHVLWTEEGLHV